MGRRTARAGAPSLPCSLTGRQIMSYRPALTAEKVQALDDPDARLQQGAVDLRPISVVPAASPGSVTAGPPNRP